MIDNYTVITLLDQMKDNGSITEYEVSNLHNSRSWDPTYIVKNSKKNQEFEFDSHNLLQVKDEQALVDFMYDGLEHGAVYIRKPKPSIKTKSGQAIYSSTPSGENYWKDSFEEKQQGLYYRVRDKLNKLVKVMEYPDITNLPDNDVLERMLIKFDRDNKISGEDMKVCNDLWKLYSNNE